MTGVNPLEGGAIFDNLEAVRIANGQPGVADWLIGRVTNWDTLDEIRGEYEDTDEAAVGAFDRKFASAFPALDSLISSAVREFERSGKNAGRFDPATREKISEALGRSLEDIQADVHKAVATITGAVAR